MIGFAVLHTQATAQSANNTEPGLVLLTAKKRSGSLQMPAKSAQDCLSSADSLVVLQSRLPGQAGMLTGQTSAVHQAVSFPGWMTYAS